MSSQKVTVIGMAMFALVGAVVLRVGEAPDISEAQGEKMRESGFGVYLTTDRPIYSADQPINAELCVFNRTEEKAMLSFRSGQRYDFVVSDSGGKEIWRWSRGRMFIQMLGQETLGPGKTQLSYRQTYAGKLAPGTYKLTGTVTASNRPTSASVTVEVR